MTGPLVVLAVFSVVVGWGSPVWNAEASELAHLLHAGEQPARVDFTHARELAEHNHLIAGGLALLAAALGIGVAARAYLSRQRTAADLTPAAGGLSGFLAHKWYFDELYTALFQRPTVALAFASAAADKRPTDGTEPTPGRIDAGTLDGLLNSLADVTARAGSALRAVQTGLVRRYVLVLALTVTGLLGMLAALTR
jgi:NADH:ubiquinone oxidoreductase subunit 5 (subunit L)/multisubunit Na+/H+ antiporter MnhA subunit